MVESEKMAALKKAYAEMILNTAKEAATRVMASEKIAIRCKHELFATKDEALRLLVRLKQMIDAKIIEAEIASSSQQTKIDELEAQLQEAEGVIIDLREELNRVRDKLEKVRSNKVQPFNGKIKMDDELFDNKYCDRQHNEKLSVPQLENHTSQNAELASIIIRNKEPELYRNGFTQRIRALEGNILAGKLPPSGELDEYSIRKRELIIKESNKNDVNLTLPSLETKNLETVKSGSGEQIRKHVKVHTLRRRRARFGKPKAERKSSPHQLMKSYQPLSFLSRCKRYFLSRDPKRDDHSCVLPSIKTDNVDVNKSWNELEEKLHCQSFCFMDEKNIGSEGKRQRKLQSWDATSTSLTSCPEQHETFQPCSTLCCCKTCSLSLYDNLEHGEDRSKMTDNEVKLKPLPRLDPGLTLIKSGVDPVSGFTDVTVSVKALNKSGLAQNTSNKDMELVDVLVKQKCETTVNSSFSCCESNSEMVNVPLLHSDSADLKVSKDATVDVSVMSSDSKDAQASGKFKVSPSQVNNNGILKYTFQRKRKKEALNSSDQNSSIKRSDVKRRAGERQNDLSDPQTSSFINESSRDSRQLAQVARQLISLSGKGCL
ncbi:uncharacterized protein LOC8280610 [Ricinus communis]|uniref:uncharacterized protein LOC8280610 n=1 Tax=Ricinus communis TaxID=3988 RepID=UPI00201AFABC|nr:uncharacterized protein LOC8280610 [Ricinus communis]